MRINEIKSSHLDRETKFTDQLSKFEKQLSSYEANQIENEVNSSFKEWQKIGKLSFSAALLFLFFGILELLPAWSWNYPAKIVEYLNSIETTDKARFRILIAINITLLTTIIISLFVFAFNRLWHKRNMKKIKDELYKEKTKR